MKWFIDLLSRGKLSVFYFAILFLVSVIPLGMGTQSILMDNYTLEIRWDYLLHAMVYLPLPILLMLYLRKRRSLSWIFLVLAGLAVPVLFEMVQMVIPYRSFNINDMVANGVGVMLGFIPAVLVWRRFILG